MAVFRLCTTSAVSSPTLVQRARRITGEQRFTSNACWATRATLFSDREIFTHSLRRTASSAGPADAVAREAGEATSSTTRPPTARGMNAKTFGDGLGLLTFARAPRTPSRKRDIELPASVGHLFGLGSSLARASSANRMGGDGSLTRGALVRVNARALRAARVAQHALHDGEDARPESCPSRGSRAFCRLHRGSRDVPGHFCPHFASFKRASFNIVIATYPR